MPITHEWNGTILTITSDSGTSSADLRGEKGDDGCRGAQGAAGTVIVNGCDLEEYATKEYVDNALTGGVSLDNYYTKAETDAAIEEALADADFDNYYTKAETEAAIEAAQPNLTGYALKSEIPSMIGYATEKYVDDAITTVLTEYPPIAREELDNFYTKEETNAAINAAKPDLTTYAKKSDIPSLAGYATETYVDTAIGAIPKTDLSNYYTKAETNTAITNAQPNLTNYALKTDIPDEVEAALDAAIDSGVLDGCRGTSILKVTTTPTSYTTETAGIAPIKRMSISTIKTEAMVDEVLVGDMISHSYYLYRIYYLDSTYAYMDKSQSIRGSTGKTGSTGAAGADGVGIADIAVNGTPDENGYYYITINLTDGQQQVIPYKDGVAGYTPQRGVDYWTEADKEETEIMISSEVAEQTAKYSQVVPLYADNISECTDTSRLYVLADGYLYANVLDMPEITIETTKGGHYNANGAWVAESSEYGQRTNLIPVKAGDMFRVTSMGKYNASVIWFNSSQGKISSEVFGKDVNTPETKEVTAPANAAYVRFYSYSYSASQLFLVVEPLTLSYSWKNTGLAFVPADYESRIIALEEKNAETNSSLKGKMIVYDGDSIAESRTGSTAYNGGGYAKIIADITGGTYVNQAVGGAYLRTTTTTKHSVVDNLPNLPTDGDLYCFEGGINDFWNGATLGTYSESDYTGAVDATTVCGALETIFRYALNNFVGKPICFIIVHKIQTTATSKNTVGNTFAEYRDKMIGICNKYSIPYYDAFAESGLNGWNSIQNSAFLTSNSSNTGDGCHPNENGYKRYYVPQLISLFEKIMPR